MGLMPLTLIAAAAAATVYTPIDAATYTYLGTGGCRGNGGATDKVNAREAEGLTQAECEAACTAEATCVGYSHKDGGWCMLYGPGLHGTCPDTTKKLQSQCGTCSVASAIDSAGCTNAAGTWTDGGWDGPEIPFTGDGHLTTHVHAAHTPASGADMDYPCFDHNDFLSDHLAKCTGTGSSGQDCKTVFDAADDYLIASCPGAEADAAALEADAAYVAVGCTYTAAPAFTPKPPHAPDMKFPGWNAAMPGACRSSCGPGGESAGYQATCDTEKQIRPGTKWCKNCGANAARMTQHECMMACEVEPSCVSTSPLPALTIHTHTRTHPPTHTKRPLCTPRTRSSYTCPWARRSATTPGRGAQSTGRAQSCGTRPTLVLARTFRPGRPTAGAAARIPMTLATLCTASMPPSRTSSTSVSRRAVSPLLPGVCSPMPSGGPRKSRAPYCPGDTPARQHTTTHAACLKDATHGHGSRYHYVGSGGCRGNGGRNDFVNSKGAQNFATQALCEAECDNAADNPDCVGCAVPRREPPDPHTQDPLQSPPPHANPSPNPNPNLNPNSNPNSNPCCPRAATSTRRRVQTGAPSTARAWRATAQTTPASRRRWHARTTARAPTRPSSPRPRAERAPTESRLTISCAETSMRLGPLLLGRLPQVHGRSLTRPSTPGRATATQLTTSVRTPARILTLLCLSFANTTAKWLL